MEVDHLRTGVSDTSVMRTLFFSLPPPLLRTTLQADSPNPRQCPPCGGRARERSRKRFRRVTWLNSTSPNHEYLRARH